MDRPEGKNAWTVTVEAREMFDINPGDTLIILGDKQKGMAIPPKAQFSDFFGKVFNR